MPTPNGKKKPRYCVVNIMYQRWGIDDTLKKRGVGICWKRADAELICKLLNQRERTK